jgi:thiosulfate/3-mercaptopyruvate sulfurtransferase
MTTHSTVVSVQWLHEHLDDPQVVIADCRFSLADPAWGRQHYDQAHIPGAYYLDLNHDLSSPAQPQGGRHPLPRIEHLAAKLAEMGIHSHAPQGSTLVVAYDDSRLAFAARCWWLLHYLGHTQVAILEGGFAAWNTAGLPITSEIPAPKTGQFVPQVRPALVVDRTTVQARKALPHVVLVDSREPARYRGESEPIDPVAGHIPGAVNYPWQEVTDAQGYLRPLTAQQQRWSSLTSADEVIVYCGSGVTACVNLLSMAIAQGAQEDGSIDIPAKLYAGSWSDWCADPDLPIARQIGDG